MSFVVGTNAWLDGVCSCKNVSLQRNQWCVGWQPLSCLTMTMSLSFALLSLLAVEVLRSRGLTWSVFPPKTTSRSLECWSSPIGGMMTLESGDLPGSWDMELYHWRVGDLRELWLDHELTSEQDTKGRSPVCVLRSSRVLVPWQWERDRSGGST